MDSAIVSTILDNKKKFWKCDESENDEINLLLDNVPDLSTKYDVKKRVGHGAFSAVYLADVKQPNSQPGGSRTYAIKHIIPTSHPSRIYMELKCLKMMGGRDNIIEVVSCLRNQNHIVLVMPFFPHDPFSEYVGKLSTSELRSYLRNLFLALNRVHQFNIIHRDIKPSNFLYSRKFKRYALIDFGLAQEVTQGSQTTANKAHSGSPSAPLMETPLMNPSRVVKRKLSIPVNSPECFPCVSSFQLSSFSRGSIASPGSFKWNSPILRRSPRKLQTPIPKSPQKENVCLSASFSTDVSRTLLNNQDSPSKHTRLAKAALKSLEGSDNSSDENNFLGFPSSSQKVSGRFGVKRKREVLLQKNEPVLPNPHPKLRRTDSASKSSDWKGSPLQQIKTKSGQQLICAASCRCYGSSRLCSVCLARKNQQAPRAGTPGFRAPEVLMRHPSQTTAVDMWSAGIILLCLLSGRYPFFQAVDDLSSLSEIATVFGTQVLKKAAAKIDKLFTTNEIKPPLDLKKICQKLRSGRDLPKTHQIAGRACPGCLQTGNECVCKESDSPTCKLTLDSTKMSEYGKAKTSQISPPKMQPSNPRGTYPDSVYHLLSRLLDLNPYTRISAQDALEHPFMVLGGEGS